MNLAKSWTRPGPGERADRRRFGRAQGRHVLDPYKLSGKMPDPAVCPRCHAVYRNGRWRWAAPPADAEEVMCQACHRTLDNYPAGLLTLSGPQVAEHKAEMISLARHQEEAESREHPLNRLIAIDSEGVDSLVITTTDIHLPRRIGEAVTRAFHGTLGEHFDEGGYFVRLDWRRED